MAELFTYRPKTGIGKDLPEEELKEFNSITYDKIMELTDTRKLMRLEQYMREEEFTQTSQLARKRVVELGGKDMFPNDYDPQFCDISAEFDEFMNNFDTWQESMKDSDSNLLEMHESKQKEQPNILVEPSLEQKRKRPLILNDSTHEEFLTEKTKKTKDVRSGSVYYDQWDKYAKCAEKEIEEEEEKVAKEKIEEEKPKNDPHNKETTGKKNLQQRLLAIGKSKSMTEKQWFAEREREKGNDLFKAKEYSASIEAYNMAIELFPKSPLAYGNRAASNLKLKKWDEVVKDCCTAINLDGKYMKAYMRRALANLELEKPKEAMIDLSIALQLDPRNQEIQTIIRRTEFMLKKQEEKHAMEVELERKRKEEVDSQEKKKEKEVFKNMTHSFPLSKNYTRMIIEEVEDSNFEETSALQKSTVHVENSLVNKDDTPSISKNSTTPIVCKIEEKKESKKKKIWPSRPHKHSIQSKCPINIDEVGGKSIEDKKSCKNIVQNTKNNEKVETNEDGVFNKSHDYQLKKISNGVTKEESIYSKLHNVDVPLEIAEAIQTQESIPIDHVAFGHVSKKHQPSSICKTYLDIEKKTQLKASNDKLAEEWRLNGNSFFSQGKFQNAFECYTTSLTYHKSAVAYSNRAISQIKLKNFKSAEEDANCALLIDCKFYKAYYRRGLARQALGNLEGAKVDFEEVLKLAPNGKEAIQQLTSTDFEYIPMRSGPMIIEEIDEDKNSQNIDICLSCTTQDNEDDSFNGLHDVIKNVDCKNNTLTPKFSNKGDNKAAYQINHDNNKFDDLVINSNINDQAPSTHSRQESNDKTTKQKISTMNFPIQNMIETNSPITKKNPSKKDSTIENEHKNKLKHQAKEKQEKGNTCFQKKQYTLAIECYNQSLGFDPTNAIVLANRALCFINLHEYQKAFNDSLESIQYDPSFIKAYYRCAIAAQKLGDFNTALKNYQIVLTLLPNGDEKVQKNIKDIELEMQKLASTNARFPTPSKLQSILTSEVYKSDDIALKPLQTTIYKNENKIPTIQQENIQLHSNTKNVCKNDKLFNKNNNIIKESIAKESTPTKVLKNIENIRTTIPPKPTSALEFERVCHSLKENPKLAREFLKSIETCKYSILFKESLSASIMQCFIQILQKGFMPNDPMGAVDVLRGLTKIKRFSLVLLLVSPCDKQGLDTVFYWLEFSSETLVDDIQELRKIYHVL